MPQGPIATIQTPPTGGNASALNLSAAAVVKASKGRVARIVILAPGSGSGNWVVNDCAATGDATTANRVWTMAFNATANVAGAVITLDWPCAIGIVLSAVPGAGSPLAAISYD